jgi:hypothetical protein
MATSGTFKQRIYHAMKEYLVMAIYLWVIFGLFALYRSVILAEQHVDLEAKSFALINALALGKVMLIAKELRLGEWFNDAPLIYPTVLKSALFAIVLAVFKILEETAVGLFHGQSVEQSLASLGGGTLNGILTLTLLLFVMLVPFFAFTELQTVVGEGKLAQVFLHSRTLSALQKEGS